MSFTSSALGASLRLALVGALLTFAVNTQARAQEQPAGAPAVAEATGTPTVAAAASLRYALDEIAKRFEKETGKSVQDHLRRHRQSRAPDRGRCAVPGAVRRRRCERQEAGQGRQDGR